MSTVTQTRNAYILHADYLVLDEILSQLESEDILRCRRVCRLFDVVINRPHILAQAIPLSIPCIQKFVETRKGIDRLYLLIHLSKRNPKVAHSDELRQDFPTLFWKLTQKTHTLIMRKHWSPLSIHAYCGKIPSIHTVHLHHENQSWEWVSYLPCTLNKLTIESNMFADENTVERLQYPKNLQELSILTNMCTKKSFVFLLKGSTSSENLKCLTFCGSGQDFCDFINQGGTPPKKLERLYLNLYHWDRYAIYTRQQASLLLIEYLRKAEQLKDLTITMGFLDFEEMTLSPNLEKILLKYYDPIPGGEPVKLPPLPNRLKELHLESTLSSNQVFDFDLGSCPNSLQKIVIGTNMNPTLRNLSPSGPKIIFN